jgi:8-amino-7-oxononanoate synthase
LNQDQTVLDFTSCLYLGLHHESDALPAWSSLSTGKPAALEEPPGARRVARKVAKLQGCEAALMAPSTLHLFWDLFGYLADSGAAFYVDSGAYPIARWGVERAAAREAIVRTFRHHDSEHLRRLLMRESRGWPVVVVDGLCPGCGGIAPLREYADAVGESGLLVIDDTQALGILGRPAKAGPPYGSGGGGSLRWHTLRTPRVVAVSSLAKAFGAPVAAVAGCARLIHDYESKSETRVHCSPPTVAVLKAAERALAINEVEGDIRRLHLSKLVRQFRARLRAAGIRVEPGLFPIQPIGNTQELDPVRLHGRLLEAGVSTILRRGAPGDGPRLSFILTAAHSFDEVKRAAQTLVEIARGQALKVTHEAQPKKVTNVRRTEFRARTV